MTVVDNSLNIFTATFSPDGTHVAGIFSDFTVWVWNVDVPKGNLFKIACASLPDHDLTDVAHQYGLTHIEPICDGDPPLPDAASK